MISEHLNATPSALASSIADALRAAIVARGDASLAVSGGKSPIGLFQQLCKQPLDWSKVQITLVDERCVAHDHADSNTALVHQHLLQGAAAAAAFVPLFGALPAEVSDAVLPELVSDANQRLSGFRFPLDVIVLGMGEDGHTASLFPAAPGFEEALASPGPIAWVRPATAPHARLTLTLPVLLAAHHVHLQLSGEAKLKVYQEAQRAANPALPISLLLNCPACDVQVWTS
jgi:6-phosphogluconolactonase